MLNENPRMLFAIDGVGAFLSAFLLGVILVKFERIFGIPPRTLYLLASLPILFGMYDFYCYRNKNDQLGPYLKGIAIANFLYCLLSISMAFYHFSTITHLGWAYILLEVLIVITLAIFEFEVAKRWIRGE
jgi:hypothetical protein